MRSPWSVLSLLVVLCGTPWGCASGPGDDAAEATAADAEATCAAAAEHVSECLGLPAPTEAPTGPCDAARATAVVDTDCVRLVQSAGDRKADGLLSDAACAMGVFSACEVPACPPLSEALPPAADCEAYLNFDDCHLCSFYDCRAATSACDGGGYLETFMARYCRRYALVTEPRVSPAAQAWLGRVRHCLAEGIDSAVPPDADCDTTRRLAQDTHTQCYLETGFCELSLRDWLGVLETIDPGDAPLRTMLETAQGCLHTWIARD